MDQTSISSWHNLLSKSENCKNSLTTWSKSKFKRADLEINILTQRIQVLQNNHVSEEEWHELQELQKKKSNCYGSMRRFTGIRDRGLNGYNGEITTLDSSMFQLFKGGISTGFSKLKMQDVFGLRDKGTSTKLPSIFIRIFIPNPLPSTFKNALPQSPIWLWIASP